MSSTPMRVFGDFANEAVGGITFHRVAAPSARLPPAPRFLLGSIPHQNLTNFYSLRAIGSVGVFAASGLCLSGEYILTRDNFYYRCPELNIYVPHIMQALARRVEGPLNRKKLPGQYAMITGPGHRIYGHWLVEHLPKLVLLSKAGFAVSELKFLIPESVPSFAVSWLELLGIRSEQLVRYDPNHDVIQADELLMPTIMHNGNRISDTFSDVVTFFRQQLGIWPADQAGTRFPDRIFISRARTSQTRALLNRDRIEAIAQRAGFTLVYPEQMPLLEQVQLFAHARQVIGEYGSGLHSTIFSGRGTIVCGLRGDAPHPGYIQSGIGYVLDQPTGYVFGETIKGHPAQAFSLDENLFEKCLQFVFRGDAL